MYNPISGNTDDEYVEIYNRTASTISLAGWEFVVGITYAFPTNAVTNGDAAGGLLGYREKPDEPEWASTRT